MYKLREAAELAGLTQKQLRHKVDRGEIPFVEEFEGKQKFRKITKETLQALIKKNTEKQGSYTALKSKWAKEQENGYHTGIPLTPKTIQANEYGLKRFWHYLGKKPKVELITADNLRLALSNVAIDHKKKNCKFSQRDQMYKAVCSFTKLLIREGYRQQHHLSAIMTKEIKPRQIYPPRKTVATKTEVEELIMANKVLNTVLHDKLVNNLIIILAAYAGLRRSEICDLQLKDIDLKGQKMVVWGKGRKKRVVGIHPQLDDALKQWIEIRPESDFGNLLLSKNATPLDTVGVNRKIKRLADKTGIDITPHGLRRSFATIMEREGMQWSLLQLTLGHNDLRTTQSYVMPDEQAAVEFLAKR